MVIIAATTFSVLLQGNCSLSSLSIISTPVQHIEVSLVHQRYDKHLGNSCTWEKVSSCVGKNWCFVSHSKGCLWPMSHQSPNQALYNAKKLEGLLVLLGIVRPKVKRNLQQPTMGHPWEPPQNLRPYPCNSTWKKVWYFQHNNMCLKEKVLNLTGEKKILYDSQ